MNSLTGERALLLNGVVLAPVVILASFIAGGVAPRSALAQSLWDDRSTLFSDFRAAGIDDLITILIVESASGQNSAEISTNKKSEAGFDAGPGFGALDFIPLFKLKGKYESKHDGDGEVRQSGQVRAKITARVDSVRANGDLQVVGTRFVTVNGERQEIRITGVVRPRDITHDNTVLSTFVGEARVDYLGKGSVTDAERVGFWKRIVDWIL
jgi:flagellar L-ring protein precursor FlgH